MSKITRKYKKEDLKEFVCGGNVPEFEMLSEKLFDHSRWSVHYEIVFKDTRDNTLWTTNYSRGATESQDEQPFDYVYGDEVTCFKVKRVEKVVVDYEDEEVVDGSL